MGKYEPLRIYLLAQERELVPMTFAEIESVIGSSLPNSKQFRAWWSNNPWNNVMTKEWLGAGYQTESVDVEGEKLVFRRVEKAENAMKTESGKGKLTHPGFGFMKGLMTVERGYDLTRPTSELWLEGDAANESRDG